MRHRVEGQRGKEVDPSALLAAVAAVEAPALDLLDGNFAAYAGDRGRGRCAANRSR